MDALLARLEFGEREWLIIGYNDRNTGRSDKLAENASWGPLMKRVGGRSGTGDSADPPFWPHHGTASAVHSPTTCA